MSSSQDKFEDYLIRKNVELVSWFALMCIGLWMILMPQGIGHKSVEKASVYIFKLIWSLEAGVILLALSIIFIVLTILKVINLRKGAWFRNDAGYYVFINKKKSSGNESFFYGKDIMVFHSESGKVFMLKNYENAKHNKFFIAPVSKTLDAKKTYWHADNKGFYLFHKGKRVKTQDSKYNGDDLYTKAPEQRKSFKLPNYKNRLDNKIYEAEILN